MPIHDWTRVPAGTFHAFHNAWITFLQKSLNEGLLPPDYYALGEQRAGAVEADVLTLHSEASAEPRSSGASQAVLEHPPRVQIEQKADSDLLFFERRRRTLVLRHISGDRVVALLEIASPSNKHSRHAVEDYCGKVWDSLLGGVHVMSLDLLPPGRTNPHGLHGQIWEAVSGSNDPVSDEPFALASYLAAQEITAFVEPCQVGDKLVPMPLFLTPDRYINVPLEETYTSAFETLPATWRERLAQ
jgi:hypothetical protein